MGWVEGNWAGFFPVAGGAGPAFRVGVPRGFVDGLAAFQDLLVLAGVPLVGGDEVGLRASVLVVVPVLELGDPGAGRER